MPARPRSGVPGKRERLVAAARELVYRQGVARTTLAGIAEAAEVPVGNNDYYFKTKDDIIGGVVRTYEDQLQSTLAELERLHRNPQGAAEGVRRLLAERAADSIAQYGPSTAAPMVTLSAELAKQTEEPDAFTATLITMPLTGPNSSSATSGDATHTTSQSS